MDAGKTGEKKRPATLFGRNGAWTAQGSAGKEIGLTPARTGSREITAKMKAQRSPV
jgi:hypothetical protein